MTFADQRRYKCPPGLLSYSQRGAIPIINENDTVSVAELKLVTMIPWVRRFAAMAQADLLVLLTDVDGL